MSWEQVYPVAVVDEESRPVWTVTRCKTVGEAEWFIGYLHDHGGQAAREKIERGGYGIDAPE